MYYVIEQSSKFYGTYVDWEDIAACPIRGKSAQAPGTSLVVTVLRDSGIDWGACDFLPHCPIISSRLKSCLDDLALPTLELVPVELSDKSGQVIDGYWYLNPLSMPEVIDMERSDLEMRGNKVRRVHRFALSEDKLSRVSADELVIFRPKEYKGLLLVDDTVAEAIKAVTPGGLDLVQVDQWNIDRPFSGT